MPKKVDIIVVNWNSGEMTMKAVAPYLNYYSAVISCRVIVVDNGSTDHSLSLFAGKINHVIANTENLGFGKACNQAFAKSDADYILLLNPDSLSHAATLEAMVLFLEENNEYASTGPQQVNEAGHVLRTCGRFPEFKTALFDLLGLSKMFPRAFKPAPIMIDWDHLQSKDVDHVMGSYAVIRKSVLDNTGFLDEAYFVYMEDLDLHKRMHDAGFKTFFNAQHSIFHEGGGTGEKMKANRLFYSLSSRNIYWEKHLNKISYLVLTMVSVFIEPFLRIADSLLRHKNMQLRTTASAYSMYIKRLVSGNK